MVHQSLFQVSRRAIDHSAQHEVGLRGVGFQVVDFIQLLQQPLTIANYLFANAVQLVTTFQGSQASLAGGDRNVVRLFYFPKLLHQRQRKRAEPQPQPGQTSPFAESP